ncbi:hypothetical protein Btru_063799 [Bulinus truncatus]|nr:hypothetical protein Btru_063799 [Bulinus truncatus]
MSVTDITIDDSYVNCGIFQRMRTSPYAVQLTFTLLLCRSQLTTQHVCSSAWQVDTSAAGNPMLTAVDPHHVAVNCLQRQARHTPAVALVYIVKVSYVIKILSVRGTRVTQDAERVKEMKACTCWQRSCLVPE